MTPDQEARRAAEAASMLRNPLLVEAFAVIEGRLISELAKEETTVERAEYVRKLLVASRKFRGYLEQLVETGKMVELDEQRKRTFMGRISGR